MDETLKILLLESFPEDAKLVESELEKGKIIAKTLVVDNKADFIKALNDFSPDIILSDQSLPDFNSIDALKLIKESNLNIPFILTTTVVTVEFAVQILREGADDCILKSNLTRLPAAIMEIIKKRTAQNAEKKAKQELDDNRERILFHLENSSLGYIEWDKDGLVKRMSKRAEEIFGYTEQEFKETIRSGYSLVYGPDLEFTLEIGKQLISGIIDNNLSQCRNITKDGRIIWCEWFHSTLKNKSGKVTTIMSLAQDITERKQIFDETLLILEKLQVKNKELKQFAFMISHNLRSPIIKIQGMARLLKSNLIDENIKANLYESINLEATTLDNIVKDINTLITAQDSDSHNKEYLLFQSKIDQVRQVLKNEIAESGAVIKTDFSEADGVFTVRSFLYSVFYNLISNAIKYRRQVEYLHIDISSKLTEDFTCIIVSDNGSGIDLAKHRDKIFGLYKRFHTKEIQGRGIGLNLVKTQVESLGGKIEVESIMGKGTTFKIYIPNIKN